MNDRPEVRLALVDELPTAGRILAAAFVDDPVWTWLTGRDLVPRVRSARFFATQARLQQRNDGEVYVAGDDRAAAVWARPGRHKADIGELARIFPAALGLFRHRLPIALRALNAVERTHPAEPHWYLAVLGTEPEHQGKGLGSTAMRPVLDRCDDEGTPAYLESSKEANVPFYERHGFEVTRRLDLPAGGPPVFCMWRDPRPPSGGP